MNRYLILSIYVLFWPVLLNGQNRFNNAFDTGEELTYRVYYSSAIIDATAGEAVLKVTDWTGYKTPEKDTVYHIIATGRSKGLFDFFYKVRDKYESYINKQTLLPYTFVRNTSEGDYKQFDFVNFDQQKHIASTSRKTLQIPEKTFDLISAIYYMRTLNVSDFNADSLYLINFYLDDSVYRSAVKYMGKDTLKVTGGRLPVIKIAPMMATGEVFADKYPMFVWVTDDKNHIPVLAASKIIVGSIKVELTGYKNLKNPMLKPIGKHAVTR
jgi:hypothetical protein